MPQERTLLAPALTIGTVSAAAAYLFVSGRIFECIFGPQGGLAWPVVLPGPIAAVVSVVFALAWRTSRAFSRLQRRLWAVAVCIAIVGFPLSYVSSNFFNHFKWDLRN